MDWSLTWIRTRRLARKTKVRLNPSSSNKDSARQPFSVHSSTAAGMVKENSIPHTNTQSLGNIWASLWHQEPSLCFLIQPEQLTQTVRKSGFLFKAQHWIRGRETTHCLRLCTWYWKHFLVSRAELHKQAENLLNHEQHAQWQNCESQLFWAKHGNRNKKVTWV